MDHESRAHDLKLARLNFILNEISSSNAALFKLLVVYQTLATAIIGGLIGIVATTPQLLMQVATGLRSLFLALSGLVAAIIIAQVLSWFDFRREETSLPQATVHDTLRTAPTWRNAWRGPQTYLLATVALFAIVFFTPAQQYLAHGAR